MITSIPTQLRLLAHLSTAPLWGTLLLYAVADTHAQTGPFAPTNWPPTVSSSATVNYGVFDPNANFSTPSGWNPTVSLAAGTDQSFQSITLGGLTGDQSTSTYVNIADTAFTAWVDTPVLDILLQVYGNGNLYRLDGSGINISFLTGTLLNGTQNNLNTVSAGLTPPGADNSQWNWMLLSITNAISPITTNRYVGFIPANAAGGFQSGGVNGGTLRIQNLPGIIVRAVAIGPTGAFGTSNQVNVFAPPPSCPDEAAVNLAYADINAGLTNHLVILNNGDQTVSYQSDVGPANDRRRAVQASSAFMNFGILSNYLGAACNFPRPMKVCVEVYDDPSLAGASFGPEAYATDSSGDTAMYQGPLYTLQGSDQWLKIAFVVPNVGLAGINTAPLTGGPRLTFTGGFPFIDRVELGVFRTGTNALAGLDPDSGFYLDPAICTTNYGIYAELDLQNGINNNLAAGTSAGDQLMVQELAGPANDQRLSLRPDSGDNNIQFSIQNQAFGPTYQDNARVAQVLTYYDDPAIAGARLFPQVYQSWVGGVSSLKFPNPNIAGVTLRGTGKWLDAYFELPDANFAGVNQGPQSLVRYQTIPAKPGDPTSGYVHVTRVRYAVIRPCGPYAGINLLQTNKPLADLGDTVSGFQDDFSAAVRNTNWAVLGPGGDNYVQQAGLLKVFVSHGDPNHLVYAAGGYSNDVQEIVARVRVVGFQSGDAARAGVGVGIGTNSEGMNFLFRDYTNEAPVRHFQFRDDARAWSPSSLNNDWTNNTWYWLRLRKDPKMDGTNTVFGKVWPADWVTPEPVDWQLTWADSALPAPQRTGYAGLTASSNDGLAQFEVSYFLLKAAGLPGIVVSTAASPPGPQAPAFIGSGVTANASNITVTWFGQAALLASELASGPWTNVVSTTNSYTTPLSKANRSEFYRLQYGQ